MEHEGFTPGPWTVRPAAPKAGWNILGDEWSPPIARVYGNYGGADAHLIAAAPSLLAENERLRELLKDLYNSGLAVHSAIANARGVSMETTMDLGKTLDRALDALKG